MPPKPRSTMRLIACAAAMLLVAAGCGGGTAAVASSTPTATAIATPSPTPSASPRPSPSPTRAPTASPSPAPSSGVIDALKIGSPYQLVYNPANQALSGHFDFQIGSITVTETLTGREIHQRAKVIGLLYVLEFDGVPMNDAAFEGGARGAAATSGGKLTYAKVLGQRVAYVVAKTATFGMYRRGDVIVMVGAEKVALAKTLLASVIKANL